MNLESMDEYGTASLRRDYEGQINELRTACRDAANLLANEADASKPAVGRMVERLIRLSRDQ